MRSNWARPLLNLEADVKMIDLPHGGKGATFDAVSLRDHIVSTGRNYIIQGQVNCSLKAHEKLNSLDYWLRVNFTANQNTRQATNPVLNDLVKTGLFVEDSKLRCPDSGGLCKGLRIT